MQDKKVTDAFSKTFPALRERYNQNSALLETSGPKSRAFCTTLAGKTLSGIGPYIPEAKVAGQALKEDNSKFCLAPRVEHY